MMRLLIKLLLGALTVCLFVYFFHFVYPFAVPLVLHRPQGWLHTLINKVAVAKIPQYSPFVILGFACVMYLLVALDLKLRRSDTYGSSRYATFSESLRFVTPFILFRALFFVFKRALFLLRLPLIPTGSTMRMRGTGQAVSPVQPTPPSRRSAPSTRFVVGRYLLQTISLTEEQQWEHVLLTAPTGRGKSSLIFIPNLLRERGSRSLFIADLKDELFKMTAGCVSQYHTVKSFAPTNPAMSQSYNPLRQIRGVEDAQDLADCWVQNTGESRDPFWSTCARQLISAVAIHLHDTEPDASFTRLVDIITSSYKKVKGILSTTPSGEAQRLGKEFLGNMEENERLTASIMSDIGNRFQIFASPKVRQVTGTSPQPEENIDFDTMNDEIIALYLCVPRKDTRRLRPLLATFCMQLFAAWDRGGTSKACYFDEFTKVGRIPGMGDIISMARYLHIAIFMAVQDFSQLWETYGKEEGKTIRANAGTHLVLGGVDQEVAQYYSERIGDTTVPTASQHTSGYGIDKHSSWTQGETSRRLIKPEEIRTMAKNVILMVPNSLFAMKVKGMPYYKDRLLKALANLPFHPLVRVCSELPSTPSSKISSSNVSSMLPLSSTAPSIQKGEDDDEQHFLQL